jgi:hypothetical protein
MLGSLRALRRKVNWWLGLAGNINLVYAFIFGGAASAVLMTVSVYVVSFFGFALGIPVFFRVVFYAGLAFLWFALANHGR